MDTLKLRTRKSGKNASTNTGKFLSVAIVSMMIAMSFAYCFSMDAKALEFVDNTSIDTPWTSDFTPVDSAWDSTGTQCIVVGNDTSGLQSSAWHYNEPSNTWTPIYEGSDPTITPVNRVENDNTGIIYATIQTAVNAAFPGNKLNIWAGTYYENVVIEKPLTLIGNGSANTIINGSATGNAVTVKSNGVTLNNFQVTWCKGYVGILLNNVQNCRVENITAAKNTEGIRLDGSSNNVLVNNYIQDNGLGVRVKDSGTTKSLVGLTETGGDSNYGAMFKMSQSGTNYSVTHNFNYGYTDGLNPYSITFTQDIFDTNILYGMTRAGGTYNAGTIFRMDKFGSNYQLLHEFRSDNTDGQNPIGSLTQSGSVLYGMTESGGSDYSGVIFRLNTDGTGYSVIYNFTWSTGAYPQGSLLLVGATLYGMAPSGGSNGYGVIFRVNMDGTGYTPFISFTNTAGPNYGSYPYGSLILDTNWPYTTLFGMTSSGGSTYNAGCLFKLNLDGSGYKCMLNFTGTAVPAPTPPNPPQGWGSSPRGCLSQSGTTLYGITTSGGFSGIGGNVGALFRINTDGTNYKNMYNFTTTSGGYNPYGSLVQDASNLYGMTAYGGTGTYGTVFSFNKGLSVYTPIYSFTGTPDGQNPQGTLLYDGAAMTLYGMTQSGGTFNAGTAFKMRTDGSFYQILHNFDNTQTNGRYPYGAPAQSGQYLYGVTSSGGFSTYGCIFRTDLNGNGFIMLHNFTNTDGSYPYSSPIVAGGVLYGTTNSGGVNGCGVLYRMNLDGTGFTLLHEFVNNGIDGRYPYSPPLLVGTTLYGMTGDGGTNWRGTIYSYDLLGNTYQVLYSLTGTPAGGAYPRGSLVSDGTNLYGMTQQGGTSDYGCVFKAAIGGSAFTLLHSFSNSDGSYPYGSLVLDGTALYGITSNGGANNAGVIFRTDTTTGSSFNLLRSFSFADGTFPRGGLTTDGSMLYGMTNQGGYYGSGTVFRMNKATLGFSVIHDFAGQPNDGAYPYYNDIAVVTSPAQTSNGNFIRHNNFIGNVQHANDTSGSNSWDYGIPSGGNYWGGYIDVDANSDGIWDTPYAISGAPGVIDSYPWMQRDGWAMPYTSFKSVAWDNVYRRFWICGDYSGTSRSTIYYIPETAPTTMIPFFPIPYGFTALAVDHFGNLLIAGNNLPGTLYIEGDSINAINLYAHIFSVEEAGSGTMNGWNITSITFNPNDNRFYFVGNVMGMGAGIAFFTDMAPLTDASNCYLDTSSFMNSPGIGGLKSISWNPMRGYALAVGDGVYRLNQWDGNPGHALTWSTVKAPLAGTSYYDISWDSDGWVEAGIVGQSGTFGKYWRYYHTNPTLLDGYTSSFPMTKYKTCAMKPPSSPKWLIIPANSEIPRINLEEKYEGGTVSFTSEFPQIFTVNVWKQSDVTRPNLLNTQVDAGSTYTFFIEGNYTSGGIDKWNDLIITVTAWYDGNAVGMSSAPGSWASNDYRTRQFNLSYNPVAGIATMLYPTPAGLPPIREFFIASYWNDPNPHGADGLTHQLYINVTFGPQTWAATGPATANGGSNGKNTALNDANTWDMQVHIYDQFNTGMNNITYEEFGIKQFASISSSGSPSGSAPPGTTNYHLSTPCTIYYATNTAHYVTVAISDLHFGGNPLDTKLIPATNLHVENLHSLATVSSSDISVQTPFVAAGTPLYVWGLSIGTLMSAPMHGTELAGPGYTNYSAIVTPPFEVTTVDWWIDVPASISSGIYIGTITITIMD
jgi:uncharacterized repeat protein (TIGR03803 family)/parallel beta-helix repeat protein